MAGGWLTRLYGGKHPFGIGILVTGILAVLTPMAANLHYGCLIALRIAQGLATVRFTDYRDELDDLLSVFINVFFVM